MGKDDAPREVRIGEHRLRFEPPDLCTSSWVGYVSEVDSAEFYDELERFSHGKERIFLIADIGRLQAVSGDARRQVVRLPPNLRGFAFVGASRRLKFVMKMVGAAYRLLRRDSALVTRYLDSEAEAQAWIEELRKGP